MTQYVLARDSLLLDRFDRIVAARTPARTVHVFVALADNQNQGIIPVPAKLANGEDPGPNLYGAQGTE